MAAKGRLVFDLLKTLARGNNILVAHIEETPY